MEEKVKKEVKIINKSKYGGGGGGMFYFLGFIGALVYYIQQSNTFMEGVVGVLKAIAWPAFLIHKVLGMLNL